MSDAIDAARWQTLVRHAALGFEGAPSWHAVLLIPQLDAATRLKRSLTG
jgi:hypothetical protein